MDSVRLVTLIVTALASSVVMAILVKGQRKKVEGALEMLKARGPMTLNEIASATGTNFVMKGYLMQALDGMASQGKLLKIPPPPGHPALRIHRDTRYGVPPTAVAP
jgi:hypothetical protein